jgi:hypothetical protein
VPKDHPLRKIRPKDGSGEGDDGANFRGQKRKNDTHASVTDPDSRLYRKARGKEAKLCAASTSSDERSALMPG